MTPRQRDALAWVREVGEATPWQARRAGYQLRTLDALAHQGRVDTETRPGRVKPYTVWRAKETTA